MLLRVELDVHAVVAPGVESNDLLEARAVYCAVYVLVCEARLCCAVC